MEQTRIKAAIKKSTDYIDSITINSRINVPEDIVAGEDRFFTWDYEKRAPSAKPYLFHWSYYNGAVMEGLFDLWEAAPAVGEKYLDYVRRYLDGMIVTDGTGRKRLSPTRAGYVDCHGADCCKTAALLLRASNQEDGYMDICREIYRDLTDGTYVNSTGHIVPEEYTEAVLGHNYWHSWAGGHPPKYKVWLDGIYMLQPFLARFAAKTGDSAQLALVQERLNWVAATLLAPSGLYYHACNGKDDVCPYHWTRAMGWYGMAMVDVMEVLPGEYLPERQAALKLFVDGALKYQKENGMWTNLANQPVTETNRLEVSGTAMMVYTILKGIRRGWLDEINRDAAVRGFVAMAEEKLMDGMMTDIYLKATADNTNNYERSDYYLHDEGKGLGPFIMACSEMLYL